MSSAQHDDPGVPPRRAPAFAATRLQGPDAPDAHDDSAIARLDRLVRHQTRLVAAVQDLSHARTLADVQAVVRRAAREITGADGATFVLRDGHHCHYADEDAIGPLWKGRRFPMSSCISGWAMLHREAVSIVDIYADCRIPADAYRPTFVQSLVMVPIRLAEPIGAIGNYWAHRHAATPEEIALLQALANTTAVAIENVRAHEELEQRVRDRTAELARANEELEAFSYSVSHDLRAPLRHIAGFSGMLAKHAGGTLDEKGRHYLHNIDDAARRMGQLIDDLLEFSRVARASQSERVVDLDPVVREVSGTFAAETAARGITWELAPLPAVRGDSSLLRVVFTNLLSNAVKYTRRCAAPRIVVTALAPVREAEVVVCVRDNGAGFDMSGASRLFKVFSRLHGEEEFEGTGVGLATVHRVVARHGGRVWAESRPGEGAAFFVALRAAPRGSP